MAPRLPDFTIGVSHGDLRTGAPGARGGRGEGVLPEQVDTEIVEHRCAAPTCVSRARPEAAAAKGTVVVPEPSVPSRLVSCEMTTEPPE